MTSVGDVLAPPSQSATATARRRWPRVIAAFVVGFVLAAGLAVAGLFAWDASYEGRILPGVRVGDVDLSGMDRAGATAALERAYAVLGDGRIVLRTDSGDRAVSYAEIGRRIDAAPLVDVAITTGRAGTTLERALLEVRHALNGVTLEPRLTLDESALLALVSAAVDAGDRAPIDSRIEILGTTTRRTLATSGRDYDAPSAATAALAAVRPVDAPPEVVVPVSMVSVPPTHGDEETQRAADAFTRMSKAITVTHGDDEWKLKAKSVRGWLSIGTAPDGSPWPVADPAAIEKSLAKVKKAIAKKPVSAIYLKTRGGRVVGVVPAKNGRKLDTAGTVTAIKAALDARGRGAAAAPVTVAVTKLEPKLTTAEAIQKGPKMTRLGVWKTWFPISERNSFGANIWLPAKFIDGTVLMPGQRFEWWSRIGPVTPARGYGMGGFIAGDHTDPTGALGGGMCSSSTTLFNAALRAGLQMGARANHRYYINRYPLGLDATVSKTRGGGGQTMSFTNDMDDPIVIRTFRYRSGGRGWVRYEIWGIPDGRTVSLSRPAVSNVRRAITRTKYVSTLPKGVREQVEYAADGMDVSVTRVVRTSRGRLLHRNVYRTHYALWNGLIQIGR